jgi:hypothetical protein
MSRSVRRVPLDFDWPQGKIWKGYVWPERFNFPKCASCDATGYSREARAIAETFYPHQIGGPYADRLAWHDKISQAEVDHLLAEGRLRTWCDGTWQTLPRLAAGVNASQRGAGLDSHDGINRTVLIRYRCDRLGIVQHCPDCDGHGDIASPEEREAADAWEGSDPPTGDGWQMWETTSEGSPMSPVFDTPEKLARWLADTGASAFGRMTATYGQWLETISVGDALSMISSGGKLMSGVEAMADD